MGICTSCFKSSSADFTTPDMETRRHQQAQAAERRMREQENRGIKDPDKVKRMQQRSDNIQRLEDEAARHSSQGGGLKWQVN